jgi:hypothetical protein
MLKYAKIIIEETKKCDVALGKYIPDGFSQMDVEQGYNGDWYIVGYCPKEPEKSYVEKRLAEYPSISDQLDMMYWDRVNGTNLWQETIAEIKAKYPKE